MLSSARVRVLRSRVADYDDFANSLREIDKRDDVIATVWQGKLHYLHFNSCAAEVVRFS